MTREQIGLVLEMRAGRPVLPLSAGEAAAQAYRLRMKHALPYTVIARVMGEYHGVWKGESEWRRQCRALGAPASQPWNVPPHARKKEAA